MEYLNNILCATADELAPFLSLNTLMQFVQRGKCERVRRACFEQTALYSVDSLPQKYRTMVYSYYKELASEEGRRRLQDANGLLRRAILPDAKAMDWFAAYRKPNGEALTADKQRELVNNAMILNAAGTLLERSRAAHIRQGKGNRQVAKKDYWQRVADALPGLMADYRHSLPANARRLQQKYEQYKEEGYAALISGLMGNANRQRVTPQMVRLILSIYGTKDKLFATDVLSVYKDFLIGVTDIVDVETGELINRNDFYRDGFPVIPSETSIWNIINDPKNRRLVDLRRNDTLYNKSVHTPHHVRRSPSYSLSKISMDDRDLTRKTTLRERVCAYYAYDVASGVVLGASYSLRKDLDLVKDCFRDTFRFLEAHHLGCPMEVEVEHHLMEQIEGDLNLMFPFVRFCAPGNSQEKRAEHFNKAKKYTAEKQLGQTTGRWWAKSEAYRQPNERDYNAKVMCGEINQYKEVLLPYERLVAEDREAIDRYNRQLHPDQRRYKGKTRLDVFFENLNPELPQINRAVVYRAIGYRTETTLRRSQYVQVQYEKYQLPSPQCIGLLKPNNYSVEAYWLPDSEGDIATVQLYQGDRFIGECRKIVAYNESAAERTEADNEAMLEQEKYVAKYYKMNREGKADKLRRLKTVSAAVLNKAVAAEAVAVDPPPKAEPRDDDWSGEDWTAFALNSL